MDIHNKEFMEFLYNPETGFLGYECLADFLYASYVEVSPLEDEEIKTYFKKLEQLSGRLSLNDNNALFSAIVEFCSHYAKVYFSSGLQVGLHFRNEIAPVLSESQKAASSSYGLKFRQYLNNLPDAFREHNSIIDLLQDSYMDKALPPAEICTVQMRLIQERMYKKNISHQETLDAICHLATRYACNAFRAGFETGVKLSWEYENLSKNK